MASQAQVSIILKLIDRSSKQLNTISKSTKALGKSTTALGRSLTRNVTLPLLAVGLAGVKMASDLDRSMRNIQAFGGQTNDQIKELSETFKEMATNADFGTQSAQQLSDAYFNIQSAGFLAAEGMEVLEVSARAATAGLTTTQRASEGIMTVLNAYGLAAEHAAEVSDQLFTIVKLGVITFEQLIPTLGNIVPLANAMGVEFIELGAAYVVMTKQGLNAATASTQMRAVMTQMLAPSNALQAQIESLGFASGQAMIDSLGLLGALDALGDSVGNDATEMQRLFINTRAVQGAIALTGQNAEAAAIALDEMAKAGAAQEAFNVAMQSFSAQFSVFKNTLGVFLIDIGEQLLPILMDAMQAVRDIVAAWRELSPAVQKNIVIVGALIAIGGPLLIMLGALISAIGTIAGVFAAAGSALGIYSAGAGTAAVATGALTISMSALLVPLGLLAAAFVALTMFGPEILSFVQGVISGLADMGRAIVGAVSDLGNFLVGGFKSAAKSIWDIGKDIIRGSAQIMGFETGSRIGQAHGNGIAQGMVTSVVAGAQAVIGVMGEVATAAVQTSQVVDRALGGSGAPDAKGKVHVMSIARQRKKVQGADLSGMIAANLQTIMAAAPGGVNAGGFGGGGGFNISNLPAPPPLRGGDVNITIEVLNVSSEIQEEQIDEMMDVLGERLQRAGV